MKNNDKYSDRDWEELASLLSGEKDEQPDLLGQFMADDSNDTVKKWKELSNMNDEKEINVDKAWNSVFSRMNESGNKTENGRARAIFISSSFMRVAAIALVILSLGIAATYLVNPGIFNRKITIAAGNDQKNVEVALPDGSRIFLNRNSEFSYRSDFGGRSRNVTLSGEAFFEIAPDVSKPFIIDAGNAIVRVVGTSFNVITRNSESAVEVFVKTGEVMLSSNSGTKSMALEPGYVGTMDAEKTGKELNKNPN